MTGLFPFLLVILAVAYFNLGAGQLVNTQAFTVVTPYLVPQQVTTSSSVRYALLLKELAGVTDKRAALEQKVRQYQSAYNNIQRQLATKRAACTCFNRSAIAFTAHLDKDVTVLGKNQPLPFDTVALNEGHAYDARHSQFRAPVNGTYEFHVSLSTNAGYQLVADIMLNGNPVVKTRTGDQNNVNTATNGVTLHLKVGDDIWVQHDGTIADSNRLFHGEGLLTTFSGHLVALG